MNLQELHNATLPSAYRPSEHERLVIAKIVVSQTPQLANDGIARGMKLNTAKQRLVQLGFIGTIDGEAALTPDGEELAKAQALMDESGEPTEQATEVASQESN